MAGSSTELEEAALAIRQTVLHWTSMPVSIGVGPTKVLCKVANRLAKKDASHAGASPVRLLVDAVAKKMRCHACS